jgi:glucose-6-phosphate isomerase
VTAPRPGPRCKGHFEAHGRDLDLREAFAATPALRAFSLQAPEVFADLSKNLVDIATRRCCWTWRAMRHRGHGATRCCAGEASSTPPKAAPCCTPRCARRAAPAPSATRCTACWTPCWLRRAVRADGGFTDIVNIGIGGSDLGPQMVVPALDAFTHPLLKLHFVSNVDGHDIAPVLRGWTRGKRCSSSPARPSPRRRPWPTRTARAVVPEPGRQPTSTATSWPPPPTSKAAAEFGITHHLRLLGLGGRALFAVERHRPADRHRHRRANFRALLAGAHAMDRHFADTPLAGQPAGAAGPAGRLVPQLPPLHQPQRGALPPGPARLPAYLQQLEMESNGKCVDLADGQPLPYGTSPVVWGEPGTNGQHAYFQMLHQGTDVVPVEFIAVKPRATRMPTCTPSCWPTAWRRARR